MQTTPTTVAALDDLASRSTRSWGAALAALTALPLPVVLRWRERQALAAAPRPAASFRALGSFFGQPGALRWALVVLPLYYLGIASAYPLVTPMLVDGGWPLDRIGAVSIGGACGRPRLPADAGPFGRARVGRRRRRLAVP